MTLRDAIYIRTMVREGWTVNKAYSENDRWHFRAYRESNPNDAVLGFTVEQVFESWLDRDDVGEEFLKLKVTHKEEGQRDAGKERETAKDDGDSRAPSRKAVQAKQGSEENVT